MEKSLGFNFFGAVVTHEELWVIAVVFVALFAFELGPKLLNFIKNRRSKKTVQKN